MALCFYRGFSSAISANEQTSMFFIHTVLFLLLAQKVTMEKLEGIGLGAKVVGSGRRVLQALR
jgi:hypothetical protein